MWSFLRKTFTTRNGILGAIASVVGAAGAIVALPIALPAALVAAATKVVVYGTTVGVIAAKVLPGNGKNAPSAGPGQAVDLEIPAELRKPGAK